MDDNIYCTGAIAGHLIDIIDEDWQKDVLPIEEDTAMLRALDVQTTRVLPPAAVAAAAAASAATVVQTRSSASHIPNSRNVGSLAFLGSSSPHVDPRHAHIDELVPSVSLFLDQARAPAMSSNPIVSGPWIPANQQLALDADLAANFPHLHSPLFQGRSSASSRPTDTSLIGEQQPTLVFHHQGEEKGANWSELDLDIYVNTLLREDAMMPRGQDGEQNAGFDAT